MSMPSFRQMLCVQLLAWSVVALLVPHVSSAFPRKDPRARVDNQASFYWIDNERILFLGYSVQQLEAMKKNEFREGSRNLSRTLYSGNSRSGEVRELARVDRGPLCFSAGTVLYAKNGVHWRGPLGREEEQKNLSRGQGSELSPNRCTYLASITGQPGDMYSTNIVHLREAHGYMEIRPRDPKTVGTPFDLYLWRPGAKEAFRIPEYSRIDAQNLSNGEAPFYEFKGAYFFYTPGVSGVLPNKAWWLFANGTTEPVVIPQGPWNDSSRTIAWFIPARDGLLIFQNRPGENTFHLLSKASSGYSSQGSVVFEGPVQTWSLSPNGCNLALSTTGQDSSRNMPLVIEIRDVCSAQAKR